MSEEKKSLTPPPTERRDKFVLGFGPPMIALIGVLAGATIVGVATRYNNQALYRLQHRTELQETSYARLTGLKLAVTQAVQSHMEARLSAEMHYLSFRKNASEQIWAAPAANTIERKPCSSASPILCESSSKRWAISGSLST